MASAFRGISRRAHLIVPISAVLALVGATIAVDEIHVAARSADLETAVRTGLLDAAVQPDLLLAIDRVRDSLRLAGFDPDHSLSLDTGSMVAGVFHPDLSKTDAFRVEATRSVPYPVRGLLGIPGPRVTAVAIAENAGEALVEIARSGGPPATASIAAFEAAVGFSLAAEPDEWAALATTGIAVDRLAAALPAPAGSDEDPGTATRTLAEIFQGLLAAAPLAGPPARAALARFAAAALAAANGDLSAGPRIRLGQVVGSTAASGIARPDGAPDVAMPAVDLIAAIVRAAAADRVVRFDLPIPPGGIKAVSGAFRLNGSDNDPWGVPLDESRTVETAGAVLALVLTVPVLDVPGVSEAVVPIHLEIRPGSMRIGRISCLGGNTEVHLIARTASSVLAFAGAGDTLQRVGDRRAGLFAGPGTGAWLSGEVSYISPEPVDLALRAGPPGQPAEEAARATVPFTDVVRLMLASPDVVATAEADAGILPSQARNAALALVASAAGPIEAILTDLLAGLRMEPGRLDVRLHAAACNRPRLVL